MAESDETSSIIGGSEEHIVGADENNELNKSISKADKSVSIELLKLICPPLIIYKSKSLLFNLIQIKLKLEQKQKHQQQSLQSSIVSIDQSSPSISSSSLTGASRDGSGGGEKENQINTLKLFNKYSDYSLLSILFETFNVKNSGYSGLAQLANKRPMVSILSDNILKDEAAYFGYLFNNSTTGPSTDLKRVAEMDDFFDYLYDDFELIEKLLLVCKSIIQQ